MKCPKCGEELKAHLNEHLPEGTNHIDIELVCINNHTYFVRIKEDDLIEC